ncbi:MAG: hypothetical protein PVI26_02760 [Chitinispirillia bacterium]
MKQTCVLLFFLPFFSFMCIKQTMEKPLLHDNMDPILLDKSNDTLNYILTFTNTEEKDKFTSDLDNFLKKYSYKPIKTDSVKQYIKIQLSPEIIDKTSVSDQIPFHQEEVVIFESDIQSRYKKIPEDISAPMTGGKITLYTDRKDIDTRLSMFYELPPSTLYQPDIYQSQTIDSQMDNETTPDTSDKDYLHINQISPQRIQIICTENLINNTGKFVTAFEIVQSWIELVKNRPAEGLALFKNVKGINKFIRGQEGVIQGFSVNNEKTITISLEQPDPFSIERLHSSKLLPHTLKAGQLFVESINNNKIVLHKNRYFPFTKSFIDECVLIFGSDNNPIVSYSLNKYDIVLVYQKRDLNYLSQSMPENSKLIPFSEDRYFISLGSDSYEMRQNLKGYIDPAKIFKNSVRAEGKLIERIETDLTYGGESNTSYDSGTHNIQISKNIILLYNTDDPISIKIAEKIFSDLSRVNIACKLTGQAKNIFEISLLDRQYDIGIGWVNNDILKNKAESIRLATKWFNNEHDEDIRISECYEIPLFTVQKFALCKSDINFYDNTISGIYRKGSN